MPDYRRRRIPGGCYFFTVNLLKRRGNDLLVREIETLRKAVRIVRRRYPFHIDGWVVLPEHMHCIWTLPPDDHAFTIRWRAIKSIFSRNIPQLEHRSSVRRVRGERGIWQRRFWEHAIRSDEDYATHMDYLHFNPVKHGHVLRVSDWPYSTFWREVANGVYPADWCGCGHLDLDAGE